MKSKWILWVFVSSVLLVVLTYTINQYTKTKVVYVRSNDLIFEYAGTKEVMADFNKKKTSWQANIDTLKLNFDKQLKDFNAAYSRLSKADRIRQQEKLAEQEKQLLSYREAILQKMQQEDERMMEGVINQINSFVKLYGNEKGYNIILGVTESGSILYADETLDITDELIEAINKHYAGH